MCKKLRFTFFLREAIAMYIYRSIKLFPREKGFANRISQTFANKTSSPSQFKKKIQDIFPLPTIFPRNQIHASNSHNTLQNITPFPANFFRERAFQFLMDFLRVVYYIQISTRARAK